MTMKHVVNRLDELAQAHQHANFDALLAVAQKAAQKMPVVSLGHYIGNGGFCEINGTGYSLHADRDQKTGRFLGLRLTRDARTDEEGEEVSYDLKFDRAAFDANKPAWVCQCEDAKRRNPRTCKHARALPILMQLVGMQKGDAS